jgi:hypothetical protein
VRRLEALGVAVLLLGAFASGRRAAGQADPTFRTRLTEHGSGVAESLPPADASRGVLGKLPALASDPGLRWQMDLRSYDLSRLDLAGKLPELWRADFDSRTVWPAVLPAGFDPASIMDTAKSPGLGVRTLHARGISGKGIGLAIVDQGLLVNHVEYRDRLRVYEEIHLDDRVATMHGAAVASLAVGRTVGVAPDADLYFIAETHVKDNLGSQEGKSFDEVVDLTPTARAIDRVLTINRSLPKDRKIRVISVSVGWKPEHAGYREVMAAVARAREEGVFVLSVALEATHGLAFSGLDRDPSADPEAVVSYALPPGERRRLAMQKGPPDLLVPMGARTTASPTGEGDYAFYRQGGTSWAVPYLAGLYALACQVRRDITPEQFWAAALATGDAPEPPAALPSREEAEARVTEMIDKGLAAAKEQYKDRMDELERLLAQEYTQRTGVKEERMPVDKFRAWVIPEQVAMEMGDNALRASRVVNPPRLIESLRLEQ